MNKLNPFLIISKEFFNIKDSRISVLYIFKNKYYVLIIDKDWCQINIQTQLNAIKKNDKSWYYYPTLLMYPPTMSKSSAPYRHYSYCDSKIDYNFNNMPLKLNNIFRILRDTRIIVVDRFKQTYPCYTPIYTCFENEISLYESRMGVKIIRWYMNHYYKPEGTHYVKSLESFKNNCKKLNVI